MKPYQWFKDTPLFSDAEWPEPALDEIVGMLLPLQEALRVSRGIESDASNSTLVRRLAAFRGVENVPRNNGATPLRNRRLKRFYDFVEPADGNCTVAYLRSEGCAL